LTFKTFFIRSLALSLGISATVALFNFYMNEYGLFGDAKGKSIKIYGNERTAKYLLSLNYIPSNFDGLLIGSSVSDNINPRHFAGYRIYNASLNGATITELKILVDNILKKGRLKCVIISLYPILTISDKKQSSRMNPQEFWGSLGSLDTIEFYWKKISVKLGEMPDYFNEYGWYNYNIRKAGRSSMKLIQQRKAQMKPDEPIEVNEQALKEFDALLTTLRAHGIKIFAYWHPIPQQYFILYEKSYRAYQKRINALFRPTDVLWDYNATEFIPFRKDYTNYCDDIHLSEKGIRIIVQHINTQLLQE